MLSMLRRTEDSQPMSQLGHKRSLVGQAHWNALSGPPLHCVVIYRHHNYPPLCWTRNCLRQRTLRIDSSSCGPTRLQKTLFENT